MRRARCVRCHSLFIAAGSVERCPGCGRKGSFQDLDFPQGGPTAMQLAIIAVSTSGQADRATGPAKAAGILLLISGILAGLSGIWGSFWVLLFAPWGVWSEGWVLWVPAACNLLGGGLAIAGGIQILYKRSGLAAPMGAGLILLAPLPYFFADGGWWVMLFLGGGVLALAGWLCALVGLILSRSPPAQSSPQPEGFAAPLTVASISPPSPR